MRSKSGQAKSDKPNAKGGHQKMFTEPIFKDGDNLTSWQKLELLASKAFSVRKDQIDPHKPVRPRKAKLA